ncbi:MAG TPA: DUF1223 domain-containing protein [Caulobacteraceae bacterium]|nr:DUF1223 domain-containing protein [Caulobacteraceae bacterium]
MKTAVVGALLGLGLAGFCGPASARPTTLVELYTAQGCASCVKSGELLGALDQKPHVLTLTFPVDYWDYLGWRDTFAKPEFSQRQHAYMRRLALHDVYTPQVVVDGRLQAPAVDQAAVEALIKRAGHGADDPPNIAIHRTRVTVGAGRAPGGGGEVWLVRYDPQDQKIKVTAGENRGRSVVEHDVVQDLVRLGTWKGAAKSFRAPPARDASLKTVVLVQGSRGGGIIAVGGS